MASKYQAPNPCSNCFGSGKRIIVKVDAEGSTSIEIPCDVCKGTGESLYPGMP